MKIELDLSDDVVERIEKLTGQNITELLEGELNLDTDNFISVMGYNNVPFFQGE